MLRPWRTVYKRFKEWIDSGLIEKILRELTEEADPPDISIDNAYVKTHKASACAKRGMRKIHEHLANPAQRSSEPEDKTQENQCIGIKCGGRSTKIHAVVDALGNPIEPMLTTGNINGITVAEKLFSKVNLSGCALLADGAYGKWVLREFIANHDSDFCIPPKANDTDPWQVDWRRYKERHVVKNFFIKLKEYRRVATCHDKLTSRFLAFTYLASARIWIA